VLLYPCSATLNDSRSIRRLLIVDVTRLVELGIPPFPEVTVPFESIVSISDAPDRMPPDLVDPLYEHGETSMGGFTILLSFVDMEPLVFDAGSIVDFPELPQGYTMKQLAAATPRGTPPRLVPAGTPPRFRHIGSALFDVAHFWDR
jgi:hypothetical protein